jgi:hypothetical protein
MLDLNLKKRKTNANNDANSEKELFEHQIKVTDKEIDKLVYELYGLTLEEIAIVEGNK